MNKHELNKKDVRTTKAFKRTEADQQLIKQLLLSPEAFITERASDEGLDKLSLKIKLLSGKDFFINDYVSTLVTIFDSKFSKDWFYRLADVYGDNRSVMDEWVKPEYARQTIVEFVYGRFPYSVIRMLRRNKRKYATSDNRLYHLLTPQASNDLDIVINDVYELMGEEDGKYYNNPTAFKMAYSSKYKVYFQTELNF